MAIIFSDRRNIVCTVFLILCAGLAACSVEASQTAFTVTPTTTQRAKATRTSEPLPSSTPTSIPSRTPIPTPFGAGPVTPEFIFQLDTSLDEIDPGQYIVVYDSDASHKQGDFIFQYISWDAKSHGPFFHLASSDESENRLGEIPGHEGRLWFTVEDPPGLLLLDIPSMRTRQFSFVEKCDDLIKSYFMGNDFLGFICRYGSDDISRYIIYFISVEDMQIVGSCPYPEGVPMIGWHLNKLIFSESWRIDAKSFRYCIAEAPDWKIECQDLPYHVGEISPDGEWVWVAPAGETDADRFREMPLAILPSDCLGVEGPNCQPKPIMPPVDSEGNYYDFAYPSWSPDSKKLLVVDVECVGGWPHTWAWYYELAEGVSKDIISLNECCLFPFDTFVMWSVDSKQFALDGGKLLDQPYVISLEGKTISYPLPITGWLASTFQIP